MGVWPGPFLDRTRASVDALLQRISDGGGTIARVETVPEVERPDGLITVAFDENLTADPAEPAGGE